jgi:hypothetical protein
MPAPGGAVAVQAEWRVLRELDFSAASAVDLKTSSSMSLDGLTLSRTNPNKCTTFGTDGSTGLRMVQTGTGTVNANTSPRLGAALTSWGTVAEGAELLVQLRWSAIATPGDFGRLVVSLGTSANSMNAGPMYRSSPGQWEIGSVVSSGQYTDRSQALSGSADRVLEFIFTSAGVRSYDRGAWSGAWPSPAAGGTLLDAIGAPASAGRSTISPKLNNAFLGVATYRTGGTTDITVHGLRALIRETAP